MASQGNVFLTLFLLLKKGHHTDPNPSPTPFHTTGQAMDKWAMTIRYSKAVA